MGSQSKHEFWNWERCKTKIRSLKGRLGFKESSTLRFLGLSISLEDGRVHDDLRNRPFPEVAPSIYCILSGYAETEPVQEALKLVSFRQLPGGQAYHKAFLGRAVLSIQRVFGPKPRMLVEAAKLLGGSEVDYRECSVRVNSLPLVPITVVLWAESQEFPASANMLFDASISHYLTTEQVAMLSQLTSARLRHAHEVLGKQKRRTTSD
ncbi:MAG: DUF3786 domain-containing protein [Candidatus Bathyarchaeota archaeon]|nr:DUF3786 domain-containing protein [Candidatus Bathyarchaeota archaeon]